MRRLIHWLVAPGLGLVLGSGAILAAAPADAQQLISRTITVDGNMDDWHVAPAIPGDPGQSSTDCEGSQACELDAIQSTGRDLKRFAYTWDQDHLYFYVERYASSSNSNTWLFYLDENTNGVMETGERIFQVAWWGSNRATESHLCVYAAATAAGDSIRGDGHTMPGSANTCTGNLYAGNVYGGTSNGTEMESRLAWSDLGFPGPINLRFHISSSRGMNLPAHVEDNMVGPGGDGGGELFPPDMALGLTASATELASGEEATIAVTLTNVYYDQFTDVDIDLALPASLSVVSYDAPAGTSFIDSDGDGSLDLWSVPALQSEQVLALEITVRALPTPMGAEGHVVASLAAWTGTDSEPGNNSDSVPMRVQPTPDLVVVKSASTDVAAPGQAVTYTVLVTNIAGAEAHGVRVRSALDPHVALALDAFGPATPLRFVEGAVPSGLNMEVTEFSDDGGATWGYTPVSGAGGAPAGHDGNVTHWRVTLSGTMAPEGASFEIRYRAMIR